ncbi:MAG: Rid family detoxifying hydrolase [Deltaproteobacteria bacterium]|jgi:2-iminobutanoate/2-iminopropanoate deaminase|nr:Rid family detoxifying hydrolase [Deltaproteobacteria bacterium]
MKEELFTPKAPTPGGPYSQGIKAGSRVYVAGQRPVDAVSNTVPKSFAEQAELCLGNVRHVLEAGGATLDDVVAVNVFLADISHFAEFNEIYKKFFKKPYPARTTISCALRGILVEINAIAEI